MATLRQPLEGVTNIVRFNWPFFGVTLVAIGMLCAGGFVLSTPWNHICWIAAALGTLPLLISLGISYLIYDRSSLYQMPWLTGISPRTLVNINAGFDETSTFLSQSFPQASLQVWDFYDPSAHTEPSIARARVRYPAYPDTQSISTRTLPAPDDSVDCVVLMLSAHEIRDPHERIDCFREIHRILRAEGTVFVTEHLRDLPNFMAYTMGFYHFHSRATWMETFRSSGFHLVRETKTTPFISTFILSPA